jgi:ribosome maturation factor RimP
MRQENSLSIDQIIEPVLMAMGFELWGYDFRAGKSHAYLRIYIDKQEGISLHDCELVSHRLSGVLDVEDPIRLPYTLEISSPGLDRVLFKEEHFRRYIGKKAKIRLKWQIEGRRNITGTLQGVDSGQVLIRQQGGGSYYSLPLEAIDRARLVPEF